MTLLTSFSEEDDVDPISFSIRYGSNTQHDFLEFLQDAIQEGLLPRGHTLVMDNASVHVGSEIILEIKELCQATGITVCLLPAYSPELNPCELVFAMIKNKLRATRKNSTLLDEVIKAAACITNENVIQMYFHCTDNIFDYDWINTSMHPLYFINHVNHSMDLWSDTVFNEFSPPPFSFQNSLFLNDWLDCRKQY